MMLQKQLRLLLGFCCSLLLSAGGETAAAEGLTQGIRCQTNDVVAFLGGADVVAAQEGGHLEALLTVAWKDCQVRFRNFGWEGDTVFAMPRDIGFPPVSEHLKRAGATLIILQFGRTEAMDPAVTADSFISAYEQLAKICATATGTTRLVLVIPPPFEEGPGPRPGLLGHNATLGKFAEAIRQLGQRQQWAVIDLFTPLVGGNKKQKRLTMDGLQLSKEAEANLAQTFVTQAGFPSMAGVHGSGSSTGAWSDPDWESLRQRVIHKNRFWFNYWRPQNWAFLGGDRTEQPSSRDHRDPKIRWFPSEMERYVPLIEKEEAGIRQLAGGLAAGGGK